MDSRTPRACRCLSSSNVSRHWCSRWPRQKASPWPEAGALIAYEVVDRTTRDLDCSGPSRPLSTGSGQRLALFGRAAPRDFVDVHALRDHFTRRTLEALAAAKDLGFNLAVLRHAFGVLDDLPRSAFEVDDATFDLLRTEFHSWSDEIGDSLAG